MTNGAGQQAEATLNTAALEPLYLPWEEPDAHRVRGEAAGGPAKVEKGRRPSPLTLVNNLRAEVRVWRESYVGASDTTRQLLLHWFGRPHRATTPAREDYEFRYYFCQREAIETAIYLKEVRRIDCLSQLVDAFGGVHATESALGLEEREDLWTRLAFKMATGSGKTKVMSLAVVWSYFHALRESDSPMAKHFVVIAPNLTVYERLKEDFAGGKIFAEDPLIPPEWRGDWNLSVVLQDEASGAPTGGVMYLTNIHRLYDPSKRTRKAAETYAFMGPPVARAKALDTGAELRDRITSHKRIMVLNDEAHHLWDPDSAWNQALSHLHETIKSRTGGELVAQLDFTATPKDNEGQLFKHIICDTPLGEAVDGGIVKTPVIGKASEDLEALPSDDAAEKYEMHLLLGYARWQMSRDEWAASGKKALLFVMCEDTQAADQIAARLNKDEAFKALNGKTINLHTNLKGKIKQVGRGANARMEFVASEKEISDEDLKALRKLSRELDSHTSGYSCIVSVLMLREGWDVRNVTCIVPLRPLTAQANILPEQTLGRGLRRMTPPGTQGANEVVTVVEHPSFTHLYQQELAQEGLPIEAVALEQIPATTVSIYPDHRRKNVGALEIEIPVLSGGYRMVPVAEDLSMDDVKQAASRYKPLPLGKGRGATVIEYEERHLFTNEVVERMQIHLPLLQNGFGAVSFYVRQLEHICKARNLHRALAPLLQTFIEERLFGGKQSLLDPAVVGRLGDSDVAEHIRAVFVPLIRERTTTRQERLPQAEPQRMSTWKPYQVTHSERHPTREAQRTLFNLVPCNRSLEESLTGFFDRAEDVATFAKNAGPQALRIDYLAAGGRLAFYTPDFFVRTVEGDCYIVEAKGREDRDVQRKARAAMAWCEAASTDGCKWEYLYVTGGVFEQHSGSIVAELARTCGPTLQSLIHAEKTEEELPLLALMERREEEASAMTGFLDAGLVEALPPRYQDGVRQAADLLGFLANKENVSYAPVFTALLGPMDEAARSLIKRSLQDAVPQTRQAADAWFKPYLQGVDTRRQTHYEQMAKNLRRTLVFGNGLSPIGLLRSCLDFALNDKAKPGGVFAAVSAGFKRPGAKKLLAQVTAVNDFRNTYVAHPERQLHDREATKNALKQWIACLLGIRRFNSPE